MPNTCFNARRAQRLAAMLAGLLLAGPALATNVYLQTPLGLVEVELFDEQAPATVANFLAYIDDGAYEEAFIHRSLPGFVVQGGGYRFVNNAVQDVPKLPPVVNEPGISNTRGTLAMAKLPDDPDSATSQWFINLVDNSDVLDDQNGGFTVFGQVVGEGMRIIDQIASIEGFNLGAPFTDLPLINYPGFGAVTSANLVFVEPLRRGEFQINTGLNDVWSDPAIQGQGFSVSVFPDTGLVFLAWFTYDTERPADDVPANLGEAGHRWLTAFGSFEGNVASLKIEVTRGGLFDTPPPELDQAVDGTMELEFIDCENGIFSYDIPSIDRQGVIAVKRTVPDNVARCEELAYLPD